MTNERIDAKLAELGLSLTATFVPHSQSEDRDEKRPSHMKLHWHVTVNRSGRKTLSTRYTQGIGHLPKALRLSPTGMTVAESHIVVEACETGSARPVGKAEPPLLRDVMYCLLLDAEVLDTGSFEDWCRDYGVDPDSRKQERIYRACIDTAIQLRALIGDTAMCELRGLYQDY